MKVALSGILVLHPGEWTTFNGTTCLCFPTRMQAQIYNCGTDFDCYKMWIGGLLTEDGDGVECSKPIIKKDPDIVDPNEPEDSDRGGSVTITG